MAFTYRNRQGKTYYLHSGPKRGGGIQYFVSQSAKGDLVDTIPEGFELYETPNAQVYLRRLKPSLITPEEIAFIQREVSNIRPPPRLKLEIRGRYLILHESPMEADTLRPLGRMLSTAALNDLADQFAYYQPVLRFILCDKEKRIFAPQRFCFRGSVDDWILIGELDRLEKLVRRYLKHLGQESFFELF
jgi:hypothetical protein